MATISASQAIPRVKEGKAILVDVREDDEVEAISIPGALHIPLGDLEHRMDKIPKETEVYFLCHSGNRSGLACEKATAHFPHAASVQGGIQSWEKAGGPVEVRSRMIPLMRQVQIAAGSLVVLGFFAKPLWFLVPIVGVGLIFAGFSGFCGMARLLQKMPWNRHITSTGGSSCQS